MDVKIVHLILIFTPRKLKHLALKDVHYHLCRIREKMLSFMNSFTNNLSFNFHLILPTTFFNDFL